MSNKTFIVHVGIEVSAEDAAEAKSLAQLMLKVGYHHTDDPRRNAQFMGIKGKVRVEDVEETAAENHRKAMNGG